MKSRVVKFAVAALVLAGAAVAGVVLLSGGDDRYLVKLELKDTGGLRNGSNVRLGGAPVGRVTALELDDRDRIKAELRLDKEVAPVGRDAKALVELDGIFGERYVDLDRGDRGKPAPSGTTIPISRTATSVRLDDVIDTLDLSTRDALSVFLRENGASVAGRGQDLEELLAAMPPSFNRTGRLIDEFAADTNRLGRLVEESDRVVREVAAERDDLGRFVGSASDTLNVVASRRRELGETVRRAPATLASARRALVSLQDTSVALQPAARGLRKTAPQLTATLRALPEFTDASVPTLRTARATAPRLEELGARGTPLVRRLAPLTGELVRYADVLDPFTGTLDRFVPDLFGLMEGWARTTQPRDAASHVFRFGASSSSDTFAALLGGREPERSRKRRRDDGADRPQPAGTREPDRGGDDRPRTPRLPEVDVPGLPDLPKVPELPKAPKLPGVPKPQVPGVPTPPPAPSLPGTGDLPGTGRLVPGDRRTNDALLDFLLSP